MKLTMVLTGIHAGKTIRLGSHSFVNGKRIIEGQPHELDSAVKMLERSWQAFPQGSDELARAQARDQKAKGTNGILDQSQKVGEPGNPDGLRDHVDGSAGPLQDLHAADSGRRDPAEPADGSSGAIPGGSGPQDSGLHAGQIKQIKDALAALDPAVDAQWTPEGLPTVEAVVSITGDQGTTRAMITAVAPDYTRAVAEELLAL